MPFAGVRHLNLVEEGEPSDPDVTTEQRLKFDASNYFLLKLPVPLSLAVVAPSEEEVAGGQMSFEQEDLQEDVGRISRL